MCGSFVKGGARLRPGDTLDVRIKGSPQKAHAKWVGYARQETLESVWGGVSKPAVIEAQSYDEHGNEFRVPEGAAIAAVVMTRPAYSKLPGDLLIVTREAVSDDERVAWPRHPLLVKDEQRTQQIEETLPPATSW